MPKKIRIDQLMVQRGLAESRAKAQALLLAGEVRVAGAPRSKPGELVAPDAEVTVVAGLPYASRGGYKLAHALDAFGLSPAELSALDVGASTGGFTDVLLQRGASRVYAVDVGYGLLDWKLRHDPRVVVIERTNIRYLEELPDEQPAEAEAGAQAQGDAGADRAAGSPKADCATIDVAFISLRLVLPAVQRLVRPEAWVIALIKPQFEAGATQVDKGSGVIRDPAIHRAVIRDVIGFAQSIGLAAHGLARSPITGPAGNSEFLAWLGGAGPPLELERAIEQALAG